MNDIDLRKKMKMNKFSSFVRVLFKGPSKTCLLACIFLCGVVGACSQDIKIPANIINVSKPGEQEKIVRAFVAAFSDHSSERMVSLCAENVVWGYITNNNFDKTGQAGSGVDQLQTEMVAYFEETPTMRSEVESLIVTGDYISVVERVYWQTSNGQEQIENTRSALSVYHVKGQKIQSVWYYPAQP